MRKPFPELVEAGRLAEGSYSSSPGDPFGAFRLCVPGYWEPLVIIANDACRDSEWWEHVSASHRDRTPTWEEMVWLKDQFWNDDEVVVQFHPAKQNYVNWHSYCLHLWRPTRHKDKLSLPPPVLVGPLMGRRHDREHYQAE
jgi:hypothetical protein